MQLKHILIMQNKIDLVKESQAKDQQDQIVKFIQGEFYLLTDLRSKWGVPPILEQAATQLENISF